MGIKAKVARGGELEETRDGAKMEEIEIYLSTLETHVKALSKATMYLVNVSKEKSTTMHELGQSLFGLHQTYDPESPVNNNETSPEPKKNPNLPSIKTISNVFASLSAINKVKHDENMSKVGSPMAQLEWGIKAARLATKRRKTAQLTYNTYLQQIKNRELSLDKLNHSATTSPQAGQYDEKIATAQKSLESAKQSANKALGELDAVTARVFREMDRFKANADEELRKLYVSHARVQVDYSKQLEGEWKKLLPNNGNGSAAEQLRRSASGGSGGSGSDKAEMLMI